MSDNPAANPADAGRNMAEEHTALFAHLVMQQSNMAMIMMGQVPNPETGETMKDLDAAQFFIAMLEMLQARTKGNLTKEEANLLQRTLMTLQMGFVEAVDKAEPAKAAPAASSQPSSTGAAPLSSQGQPDPATPPASAEDENRKKFSKKY